jgi:NADH:ubiquinone reductase (H+-translocating)
MDNTGRTVIVAGGGYSGVLAANRVRGKLSSRDRVLLVTPGTSMTHRVRLHERAVHGTDVSLPYARLLARGVEQVPGKVLGVDPSRSEIEVAIGDDKGELHYDSLILALGSELRPRIPTASPFAHALRDEAHAAQLAAALPGLHAGARVVIVGGGLTAIELATEIAEAYPKLQVEMLSMKFAEGLTEGSPDARDALLDELFRLNIQLREGVRVQALEPTAVLLEDGSRIECAVSVLASGFTAAPLPASFALPLRADGRVEVDESLRVPGFANVFAVGDLAAPPHETIGSGLGTTRMSCACAMPLGAHAADQVARQLRGQPLQPYSMKFAAQCVSIGRKRAVALFVDADDKPTGKLVRGRNGALIKEGICRMVVGAMRLERWLPGLYTWPRGSAASKTKLFAAAAE